MRNVVIGLVIGLVVGIVLGVTILTPKLKTHAASKAVVTERDLEKTDTVAELPLAALHDGTAIHWRSAPPFPSDRPNIATLAKDYAKQLAVLSDDTMILPVLPAKEVIGADRLFGALASGRIDAMFSTADIGVDKEPALSLFSALPFGPKPDDMLGWIHSGKGEEKLQDLFANHNIHALVCGFLPPESGGWFVNELQNLEDIQGLRIRINGLGARVWEKVGAKPIQLPAENIASAFEQNELDSAIFSTPQVDARTNFGRFAKHYYFPGWQNQGQPLLLLINSRAWKRLDQGRQALIQSSCIQHTALNRAKAAENQFAGLSEITKQEVTLQRTPSYILDALNQAWKEVVKEEARRNDVFRETWEELNAYLETRKTWSQMGYHENSIKDF